MDLARTKSLPGLKIVEILTQIKKTATSKRYMNLSVIAECLNEIQTKGLRYDSIFLLSGT